MKSVLITGADGFVGRVLVPTMRNAGMRVIAVTRHPGRQALDGVISACIEDIRTLVDWDRMLTDVDVVIHLAARAHVIAESASDPLQEFRDTNVTPTLNLFRACQRVPVKRFVFVSTIGVNGLVSHRNGFRVTDIPDPKEPYSVSKWEAECGLMELSVRGETKVVTVRPTLVYGPGAKGNFLRLMRLIRSGWPLPFGAISAKRSILSVTSLCELLLKCCQCREADGRTFLAADPTPIPTRDLVVELSALMGRRARLVRVDPRILVGLGRIAGFGLEMDRLTASLEVDTSAARELLDWRENGNSARDMKGMVDDFLRKSHVA